MDPDWRSKTDIAAAQVAEAIRLYFGERDATAVHTLVAAAHAILTDLTKAGVLKHVTKYPANFMKHADRDPDGRVNVQPLAELNAHYIMDAVMLLQQLGVDQKHEAKVFWQWYVAKFAEMLDDVPEDGAVRQMQAARYDRLSFKQISEFVNRK